MGCLGFVDLNNAYEWLNYNIKESNSSARQLQINLAISRNVIIQGLGNWVLAPVQEFSFIRNNPNGGNPVLLDLFPPVFNLFQHILNLKVCIR